MSILSSLFGGSVPAGFLVFLSDAKSVLFGYILPALAALVVVYLINRAAKQLFTSFGESEEKAPAVPTSTTEK